MLLVVSMMKATSISPQDGVRVGVIVGVMEGEGVGVRVVGVAVHVFVGTGVGGTGVLVDVGTGAQVLICTRPHQVPQRPVPSIGGPDTGVAAYCWMVHMSLFAGSTTVALYG